ncbi:MAG: hypothetical protein ACYTGS_19290, partial [Planctomycetota bacterium]
MIHHFDPNQNKEGGQESQVRESENIVSAPPAGDTKFLIENRPSQPGQAEKTPEKVPQSSSHEHLEHFSKNISSEPALGAPGEERAD